MYRSVWICSKPANGGGWQSLLRGSAYLVQFNLKVVHRGTLLVCVCDTQYCLTGCQYLVRDVLSALATVGNVPLSPPGTESTSSNVGQRVSDAAIRSVQSNLPRDPPRAISGYRSLSPPTRDLSPQRSRPPNYALPMYSTELGRLPVYGQFNFSDPRANSVFAPQTSIMDVQDISSTPSEVSINQFATPDVHPVSAQHFCGEHLECRALHQASTENGNTARTSPTQSSFDAEPMMDSDTMTMWSTAPAGFE